MGTRVHVVMHQNPSIWLEGGAYRSTEGSAGCTRSPGWKERATSLSLALSLSLFFTCPSQIILSIAAIFNSWQAPSPFKHPSLVLKSRKATFVWDGLALDWPNGFQGKSLSRILKKLNSDSDRDIFPWGTLHHVTVRELSGFLANWYFIKPWTWIISRPFLYFFFLSLVFMTLYIEFINQASRKCFFFKCLLMYTTFYYHLGTRIKKKKKLQIY